MAKIQLPALPQGIGGPDAVQLVLQINDRLRRIALALGDDSGTGTTGPAGPPGATGPAGPAGATGVVVGFVVINGVTGTNVGPMLPAPRSASVTKCVVVTKAADASVALTFTIRQNGAVIFSTPPTVAAATAAATVSTFTALISNPLPINASDVFSIDVLAGSGLWQFSAQLE